MNYDRARHLEMLQAVITRMANHSFVLKGWSVTLSAALFALAAKDSSLNIVWIALLPIAAFWGLDAFYLRQERLYRALFDHVRGGSGDPSPERGAYSMSTAGLEAGVARWEQTLFAPAVLGLHGVIALVAVIILCVAKG